MNKKFIIPTIVAVLLLLLYIGYDLLYFSPPGVAIKIDKIKIYDTDFDLVDERFKDVVLSNKYIVDTVMLSETAIEIGLDKELSLNDKKIPFNKREMLAESLKIYYKDIYKPTDEELLKLYEQKFETVYEYIAIDTTKELEQFVSSDLSGMLTSEGTIEDLNRLNIVEPLVDRWYVLPDNGKSNRFVFIKGILPKEKSFDDVKEELAEELKKTFSNITIEKILNQSYSKYEIFYYRETK